MYGDTGLTNAFEVIEIEPSDEDDEVTYAHDTSSKIGVPINGNCGNGSPNASIHHNIYEPNGGSGPEVVTTTNDLCNSSWYEEKMDDSSILPPPPEVTIEQCRSSNTNNKMSTIESILPVNNNNNNNHYHQQQQQQQHQHQQQQYSNSTLPLHMAPIISGSGMSSGIAVAANSSGTGNNLTPEMSYTNGVGGNVKDLINAEVTIEPISGGNRGINQHHHQSSQSQLINNITDNRKLSQNNEIPPVLTPINDPIELYCLSLVDCLRAMPRSERERVKFEFAKILKDAIYKDEA